MKMEIYRHSDKSKNTIGVLNREE